jgi:glycosyltransferase involved in cell wall biosynthesis
VPGIRRRIVLAANSAWHVANFRPQLIRALTSRGYQVIVAAPADGDGRLAALGVRQVEIDLSRSGLNPIADLRLLAAYGRILKRERPLAFLGFTIKPNIYGCTVCRLLGIPAVPNVTGLGTAFIRRGPLLWLVSALYRVALRRAEVVFFQNPDDRALFLDRGLVKPAQARLLPGSGVDLKRFAASPLPEGPVTFLFVGRILGDKGVHELVEAARVVHRSHPDVRVRLLGPIDGDNRTAISRAELAGWVGEGIVDYLGETDDVRPFVAEATAMVLPSYREGLPRSLLEGAAMGRPLIATDVPGCREVVEEGVNGFLCRVRDPASLADAMQRFIALSPDARQAMGSAARAMVERRFSEEHVIAAYLEAIEDIAAARS